MSVWAIILAAGQGSRLTEAGVDTKKQFLSWKDRPLFWHSAQTFARVSRVQGLVFVFPEPEFLSAQEEVINLDNQDGLGLPWLAVTGGERRQDSVWNGLQALPPACATVLVHDAARPFFSATITAKLLETLDNGAKGAIPVIQVKDTIKQVKDEVVQSTLNRSELAAVQTPQAFSLETLLKAHENAQANNLAVTDDASMVEQMNVPVATVPGEEQNCKITTIEDLQLIENGNAVPAVTNVPCVGWGYDVHRFTTPENPKARPFKLGGVPVTSGPPVLAHSDGDVLLHALTDALLGLICQGDIGARFPDTDPSFENMSSSVFLNEVLQDVRKANIQLTHVDVTIIAQVPKLAPWRVHIQKNLASLLHLPRTCVNVKATTEEKLGFTGEKKGIKAVAAVTGLKPLPA